MGGKNAIIVDDDADLDEAVVGILQSAFHYAGQKCSAASRLVVLPSVHDRLIARLVEATRALRVGPASEPSTDVGPVVDQESVDRIRGYQALAAQEGTIELAVDVEMLSASGNFVGPLIVSNVSPTARLMREEIFGPVLAITKANDLNHALEIVNGTSFALTGGLFSRNPVTIDRVRNEFMVGNLYINRGITGAMVGRQPFGGFRDSGIGSKAGGREYLLQFVIPRTITENTLRHGFAPEAAPTKTT